MSQTVVGQRIRESMDCEVKMRGKGVFHDFPSDVGVVYGGIECSVCHDRSEARFTHKNLGRGLSRYLTTYKDRYDKPSMDHYTVIKRRILYRGCQCW